MCHGIDRKKLEIVLSSIGSQLTRLSLIGVTTEHIYISDLQFCTRLEELELPGVVLKEGDQHLMDEIDSNSFLPNLKKFKSSDCLGVYSQLFEEKSTLTHLDLKCSHISTRASDSNWIQISYSWQNLQELSILSTVNLSPTSLFVIVPRLKKLKTLALSNRMSASLEERDRAINFIANLEKQSTSKLSFTMLRDKYGSVQCPFHK